MIDDHIGQGQGLWESQRLAAEEMEANLPRRISQKRWKTVRTCSQNWYQYMNAFGGLVGAWFFPETESAREYAIGDMWTHTTFGTHVTAAEMRILLELIRRVFPGIDQRFRHTPLETLVKDIRGGRTRDAFVIMQWESAPKGIEHAMGLAQNQPIINWKSSAHLADWERAEPLPDANPGHALAIVAHGGNQEN